MTPTRWTGRAATPSWFSAGNWTGGVPLAQQDAIFKDGRAWTISLSGTAAAQAGSTTVLGDRLTFTGGTLALDATQPKSGNPMDLSVGQGGSVTIGQGAAIDAQNTVQVGSTAAGTLTGGSLTVVGTLDASILQVTDGTVRDSGHIAVQNGGFLASVAGGTLAVSAGGTLDAGAGSLQNEYSALSVGYGADGVVEVSGRGALLEMSDVTLGDDGTGSLFVRGGAVADINDLDTGSYGAATISVTGQGSTLEAARGISLGDDSSLSGLTLSITDGGAVTAGTYGLSLDYGILELDASARLGGPIHSQVGRIDAVARSAADPGTVTLHQAITLDVNAGGQGQYATATSVGSQDGAVLRLAGRIAAINDATLAATSGSVVLLNAANQFDGTSLLDASLEIASTGAAGAGTLTFAATGSDAPVLQIDAGVAFPNTIAGFAGVDTIDLQGFAFGSGVTDTYEAGTLTLSNGTTDTSLSLAGTYSSADFAFAVDQHGGTAITLKS